MTHERASACARPDPGGDTVTRATGGAALPLRIIIIDDSFEDRAEVRRLLLNGSGRSYRFVEAQTAEAGIALVRAENAGASTCLLLDHYLPGMTSIDVLAELRDDEGLLPCPVIVITGTAEMEVGRAVLRAGAHDFIGKDWLTAAAVTRAIENAAERWAMVLELRRREVALARSERDLRITLVAAGAGTWEFNLQTGDVAWSAEMFELYGRDRNLGAPRRGELRCTVLTEDSTLVEDTVAALVKARATDYRCKYRVCHPTRGVRWLYCAGEAQYNDAGDASSIKGITIDITEIKALEQALREQDIRKDIFLATLGHELRGPLGVLSNGLHILRSHPLADVADRARAMMERQVHQMARLIEDLVDVARINRGTVELQRDRVTMQSIIEAAIEGSQPQITERRHTLQQQMPEALIWLNGDAVRLSQVFSNLLINAAKYTPVGGCISIEVLQDDRFATVHVADNGVGIRSELLDRIFEVFAQLKDSGDSARGGLGIGLSLAKCFVELHGGSIHAESAGPGLGTRFVVRLPILDASSEHPAG